MKIMILIITVVVLSGCNLTGPKETKTFQLAPSGGYRGRPVGANNQRVAGLGDATALK